MYCKHCDTPICTACITSDKHRSHKINQALQMCDIIKQDIRKDIDVLRVKLIPLVQKLIYDLEMKINEVEEKCEEAGKLISKQSDDWHKEIDKIVDQLKTELEKTKDEGVNLLKLQKSEIEQTFSKINAAIQSNEEMLESNDVGLAINFKSKYAKFCKLPIPVDVPIPSFTPTEINSQSLFEQFGVLSMGSLDCSISSTDMSSGPDQLLRNEPEEIACFCTGFTFLYGIACQSNDQAWVRGGYADKEMNFLKLYDIDESREIKSFSLDTVPSSSIDVALTKRGSLIYSCSFTKTVNIFIGDKLETLIKLEKWSPRGICVSSSGDMLVTMTQKNKSKMVRYFGTIEKQTIQFDDRRKPIEDTDSFHLYITENKNNDICVAGKVMVMSFNKTGTLQFRYTGPKNPTKWNQAFCPKGIATDRYCHILIADTDNKCVHIIDKDGEFLQYIDCGMRKPWGLCTDSSGFLLVADSKKKSGEIVKFKYLADVKA